MWIHEDGIHLHETYLYPYDLERARKKLLELSSDKRLGIRLRVSRSFIINKNHHQDMVDLADLAIPLQTLGNVIIEEIPDNSQYVYDEWQEAIVAELKAMKFIFASKFAGIHIREVPDLSLPSQRTIVVSNSDDASILNAVTRALNEGKSRVIAPNTLIILNEQKIDLGKYRIMTLDYEKETPLPQRWRARALGNLNFRDAPTINGNLIFPDPIPAGTEFWVLHKENNNGYLNCRLDSGEIGWMIEFINGQRKIIYL